MKVRRPPSDCTVVVHIGGVHVGRSPTVIRTVLGSCIASCLYDPVAGVGGMNHFLLPSGPSAKADAARFGEHAMQALMRRLLEQGAERRHILAKIFGGGHVLAMEASGDSVPQRNIRFIEEFMVSQGIPVVSRDLGGYHAREVLFDVGTAKAYVRRVTAQIVNAFCDSCQTEVVASASGRRAHKSSPGPLPGYEEE